MTSHKPSKRTVTFLTNVAALALQEGKPKTAASFLKMADEALEYFKVHEEKENAKLQDNINNIRNKITTNQQ